MGEGHRHGLTTGVADAGRARGAGPGGRTLRQRQRRVLWLVLAANAGFMVAEAVGGVVFGSLALLADAAHMLSDVAGLAIALVAQALLARPASTHHSFGLQRAEVLGAQANAVILVATAGWVLVEAWQRIGAAPDVEGGGMLVVAGLGLAVNVVSALALARVQGESLNLHGALVHMAADALGSVGAVVAAVAVLTAGAVWVDPAVSALIAVLVLWSALRLLRETTHVLLEGTPRGLRVDDVVAAMEEVPGVVGVHHVHLWSLASDTPSLSAHAVLDADPSLHEAQQTGERLRALLAERFGVAHSTLELECHVCAVPAHAEVALTTKEQAAGGATGR